MDQLGTESDRRKKETLVRLDTNERISMVQQARSYIYQRNAAVTNVDVEKLLQPSSMVPTEVSAGCSPHCLS